MFLCATVIAPKLLLSRSSSVCDTLVLLSKQKSEPAIHHEDSTLCIREFYYSGILTSAQLARLAAAILLLKSLNAVYNLRK